MGDDSSRKDDYRSRNCRKDYRLTLIDEYHGARTTQPLQIMVYVPIHLSWNQIHMTNARILAIVASIAALIYVIVAPKQGEKFTEFCILGPGGMAYNYPTDLATGQNGTVIIGAVNRDNGTTIYLENIRLGDNRTYTKNYPFTAEKKRHI